MRIFRLPFGLVLACCLLLGTFSPCQARPAWTVYLYLCGSDLESRMGGATADLQEILQASLPDDMVILIQTGGSKTWQNDLVDPRKLERYTYKNGELTRVQSLPQASMGSPKTLADFLRFGREHFPAERQMLILWDHGGGSAGTLANDENFDGQGLSLKDIRTALSSVYQAEAQNPPFELIGFDACLMASIDVANMVHGFARYMVASQDLEPGNGWEYTGMLNALGRKPDMEATELGRIICDTYLKGCKAVGTHENATLSVVDLARLPQLNMVYDALGLEAVGAAVDDDRFYALMGRQARRAENYMNSKAQGFTNMVDLGSLVRNMRGHLPEFSDMLLEALDDAVVYRVNGPYRKSSGLSCYYPMDGGTQAYKSMLDTGRHTSFLMLNGLQLGLVSAERAKSRLEAIMAEIDAMVAEGDTQDVPAPETAPVPSAASPTPGMAQPVIPIPQIPVLRPQGASALWGAIQAATEAATLAVRPLQVLDISTLEDAPVTVTSAGEARLELGPDKVRHLDSVNFYLASYDTKNDVIVLLGKDADIHADWEKGIFTDNFRNVWAALDGHLVYLELSSADEERYRYAVPAMLNGDRATLEVVYNLDEKAYRVLGARKLLANGVADKFLVPLKAGDRITTILKGMTISGEDDEFTDVEVDSFTLGQSHTFEDMDMGDGDFIFMFEMNDVQGNSATSAVTAITVRDGEITLSEI